MAVYRAYIINNNCACNFLFLRFLSNAFVCISIPFPQSIFLFLLCPYQWLCFFSNVPYTYKVIDSIAQVLNTNEIARKNYIFFFSFSLKFIVCSCLNGKIAARRVTAQIAYVGSNTRKVSRYK